DPRPVEAAAREVHPALPPRPGDDRVWSADAHPGAAQPRGAHRRASIQAKEMTDDSPLAHEPKLVSMLPKWQDFRPFPPVWAHEPRRFLWLAAIPCLAAILVLIVLGVPACGGSKTKEKPTVPDPDGDFVPKPGGAKPG